MVKIHQFVYYEHPNTDYVVQHKHDYCECIFFIDGKATISSKNVVYTIYSPSIAMIPPFVFHDEKEITDTKMFIVLFSQDEEMNDISVQSLSEEQNEKIMNIFNEIYALEKDNQNNDNHKKQRSLYSLMLSLLQAFKFMEKEDADQIQLVDFSKTYIERNYALSIDYKALSDSYGYSYSRFRHIFKDHTGMSPHQYCLSLRLAHAKALLKETNLPIKKISKSCGFNNEVSFDIAFKKEMNISPSDFRELVKIQEDGAVVKIGDKNNEK